MRRERRAVTGAGSQGKYLCNEGGTECFSHVPGSDLVSDTVLMVT